MTNASDRKTAHDAVDAAQTVAKRLNEMTKTATALAKEGKELSAVQSVMKDVKFLGTASTVLGIAGFGLGVATMLMGAKSVAEQNTELLEAMKGQIDGLERDMKRLLAEQRLHTDLVAARDKWDALCHTLTDYHRRYDDYSRSKLEADRRWLVKLNQHEVLLLAESFAKLMHETEPDENLLLATYNASFGHEGMILTLGAHAMTEAYFMQDLCKLIASTIRETEPGLLGDVLPDEDLAERFVVHMASISKAVQDQATECQQHCWEKVDEQLSKRIFPSTALNWAGYFTNNCRSIGEALRAQWPRYDWSVIVYDAIRGFDRHGVASKGIWCKTYFGSGDGEGNYGQLCESGGRANIIVAAVPVGAHIYDAASDADIAEAWYDLTLNARATMVIKDSLAGFLARHRQGLFFYCLKEDSEVYTDGERKRGVRMDFWSQAAGHAERDSRRNIAVHNQGVWEEGRILVSHINLAYVDEDGGHHTSNSYYQTVHLTA